VVLVIVGFIPFIIILPLLCTIPSAIIFIFISYS
jgi:hypothetical protein